MGLPGVGSFLCGFDPDGLLVPETFVFAEGFDLHSTGYRQNSV
jgi:hypothetical protein